MSNDPFEVAFTQFPDLRRLVELVRAGWNFVPIVARGGHGELAKVKGTYMWPGSWTDVIVIEGRSDAQAWRAGPTGDRVTQQSGSLARVVNFILDLPEPDAPTATQGIKGTTRSCSSFRQPGPIERRHNLTRARLNSWMAEPKHEITAAQLDHRMNSQQCKAKE